MSKLMHTTMHIIDAHCHLGSSFTSGIEITEDGLLAVMAANDIAMAMVMPQAQQGIEVAEVHDRIAWFAERWPGVIYGMANVSPRLPEATYRREVERCVRDLGFRAIKLDPFVHALAINHPRAEIVFACAQEFGVPVIIHTGLGIPAALPSLVIPPAQRYVDLTIVLAHAGFAVFAAEAIVAAQVCPNIVLEPSWCASFQVADMVRTVGAARVMFGSDHPGNVASELAKLRALDLDDAQLAQVMSGTARRVFRLEAPRRHPTEQQHDS
jgi:predicted TIM-barrel fold metal-dependent hydrolase